MDFSAPLHGNAVEFKAFTSFFLAHTLPAQWPTQHGSAMQEFKESK